MSVSFRERDPVVVAVVGVALLLALLFGSFQVAALPIFGGHTYQAVFDEAGGLAPGDRVTVAGTVVGKVKSVELVDGNVLVRLTAKGVSLGGRSRAEIKTKTLLGERTVALFDDGPGALDPGDTIPLERTRSPYNINDRLEELTRRTGEIDTKQVANALNQLSQAFTGTPDDVKPTLEGLTTVARVLNERDLAVESLLQHAAATTGVLRDHTQQLVLLAQDGNQLLGELEARRDIIHSILVHTEDTANQVRGLVSDQGQRLRPTLESLDRTASILRRNEGNIVAALSRISSYITGLGEGLSSGPWFQGHADVAGTAATKFPLNEFLPGVPVPAGPLKPGSVPTLPSIPGLAGVGGNG